MTSAADKTTGDAARTFGCSGAAKSPKTRGRRGRVQRVHSRPSPAHAQLGSAGVISGPREPGCKIARKKRGKAGSRPSTSPSSFPAPRGTAPGGTSRAPGHSLASGESGGGGAGAAQASRKTSLFVASDRDDVCEVEQGGAAFRTSAAGVLEHR